MFQFECRPQDPNLAEPISCNVRSSRRAKRKFQPHAILVQLALFSGRAVAARVVRERLIASTMQAPRTSPSASAAMLDA
jgi:hypothetical protein